MIDWHSHILPSMDDGSHNLSESIEMLYALQRQSVDIAIATPHFYANKESVESFLARRQKAYDMVCAKATGCDVRIICGAEVAYYPGISRMEALKKLAIQGTNLVLLEMPMVRWTDNTVQELIELTNVRGMRVVLAHIERYLALQDKRLIKKLIENGIFIQVNASFFERIGTRQRALKLLGMGYIHFIGSDCHNMITRPPKINTAYELIQRKFGENFAFRMNEYGYQALGDILQL